MGPKRFQSQNLSLLIVKFKKLGFSVPLRVTKTLTIFRNDYFLQPLFWRLYVVAVLVTLKPDTLITLIYEILWLRNIIIVTSQ